MNFDYIVLTKAEIQWLCQLAEAPSGLPSGPHALRLMLGDILENCRIV